MSALKEKANLSISDGLIHYKLYQQDGSFQPTSCKDTTSNRLFVSWVQAHDRYTVNGEETPHEII